MVIQSLVLLTNCKVVFHGYQILLVFPSKVYFLHTWCKCYCLLLILSWFRWWFQWSSISFIISNNSSLIWSVLSCSNSSFHFVLSRCWISICFKFILPSKINFVHIRCKCDSLLLILTWFWRWFFFSYIFIIITYNLSCLWSILSCSCSSFNLILTRCWIWVSFKFIFPTKVNFIHTLCESNSFYLILTWFWWSFTWSLVITAFSTNNLSFIFPFFSMFQTFVNIILPRSWILISFKFIFWSKVYFLHTWCKCYCLLLILSWIWWWFQWSSISLLITNNCSCLRSIHSCFSWSFDLILTWSWIRVSFKFIFRSEVYFLHTLSKCYGFNLILTRFWWWFSGSFITFSVITNDLSFILPFFGML